MRLTTTQRQAFVRAAMDDVPSVDYREQMQKLIQDYQASKLPKKVRTVYDDASLRGFLRTCTTYTQVGYISHVGSVDLDEATKGEQARLEALHRSQMDMRDALRARLEGVVASVTTRKALVEALPEFEKYAPAEAGPLSRDVPALANVVSDFVKAGWPKGKPAPAKRSAAKRNK